MNTVIVDYGLGNFGSVKNKLSHLGQELTVSSDIDDILKSDIWIITGEYSLINKCRVLLKKEQNENRNRVLIAGVHFKFGDVLGLNK